MLGAHVELGLQRAGPVTLPTENETGIVSIPVPFRRRATALSATSYSPVTFAVGALILSQDFSALRCAVSWARTLLVDVPLKWVLSALPRLTLVDVASGGAESWRMTLEVSRPPGLRGGLCRTEAAQ